MTEKLNKSFARRIGKGLSSTQKHYMDNILPKFLVDADDVTGAIPNGTDIYLEIGFGMGEHFLGQASAKKDAIFIGCEPYLNGVANVLKMSEEQGVSNFRLWPDDVDLLLDKLPGESLSGIYILFPDPWHKKRHHKRRIFNEIRLNSLFAKLKKGGAINFASDIHDYADIVDEMLSKDERFTKDAKDDFTAFAGYTKTKYHMKAEAKNIDPKFLTYYKQ